VTGGGSSGPGGRRRKMQSEFDVMPLPVRPGFWFGNSNTLAPEQAFGSPLVTLPLPARIIVFLVPERRNSRRGEFPFIYPPLLAESPNRKPGPISTIRSTPQGGKKESATQIIRISTRLFKDEAGACHPGGTDTGSRLRRSHHPGRQ
jgi:hypothetical protein